MLALYILGIVLAYLIGSISPAYIIGKLTKGIDIREHGTKNAGAMNSFLVLGKAAGITTVVFDMAKGVIAIGIAYLLNLPLYFIFICSLFAIIGHDFPFYLRFKGGKGAATGYGISLFCGVWILGLKPFSPLFLTFFIIWILLMIAVLVRTKSANLTMFIGAPLAIAIILFYKINLLTLFTSFIIIHQFVTSIATVKHYGGLKEELKRARKKKK